MAVVTIEVIVDNIPLRSTLFRSRVVMLSPHSRHVVPMSSPPRRRLVVMSSPPRRSLLLETILHMLTRLS